MNRGLSILSNEFGLVMLLNAIFGFHTIPRDTKDNRHGGHVGVPNKRNNQNSFVKNIPTWPPWRQVKTGNSLTVNCCSVDTNKGNKKLKNIIWLAEYIHSFLLSIVKIKYRNIKFWEFFFIDIQSTISDWTLIVSIKYYIQSRNSM